MLYVDIYICVSIININNNYFLSYGGRRGGMVVGFTTTCAITGVRLV